MAMTDEQRPWAAWVVHCKRARYGVLVDRSTPWGNPFHIGRDGTREEVIRLHEQWMLMSNDPKAVWQRTHLHELRGQILGCWCPPLSCHAETLARYANDGRRA